MTKPCPLDPKQCPCRVCHLYLTNPEYNRLWGGSGIDSTHRKEWISRATKECFYLGGPAEDPESCGCGVAVLRVCGLHGTCRRIGQPKAGERVCSNCTDYRAPNSSE